ncbi:cytidine deaminase [Chitinophaga skermanii]|uniref:Cytidine deaminase n=1 Tax=Chitinophaga skermanii TaxID=331697 RepID=A0A327QKA0_9BACT|nr:cytidine deaminase [Chitinophaga skermanii]RAJ05066.1 cytidine deaminase [Chitinophaga skermanii]
MEKILQSFTYTRYNDLSELPENDAWLLQEARDVTSHAYAPYSKFQVGAVMRLINGEIIAGSNQENASFPVGICAERVALSAAASIWPDVPIETIAVSYHNLQGESNHPISPCGICRQSLAEYQVRLKHPIRLILGGLTGEIFVVENANDLLPLSFSADDMK